MGLSWAGALFVWNGIWGFLSSVPSSFWGVLAGSILSLAGIKVTNKATLRRLELQLESDRRLKAEERRMTIRRETYLLAAEHIAVRTNLLTSFANLDKDLSRVDEKYDDTATTFARVQAIAPPALLASLLKLHETIGKGMLRGYERRLELQPSVSRRAWLVTHIDRGLQEQARWLEEMKSYNLQGVANAERWKFIEHSRKFIDEGLSKAIAEREALDKQLFEARMSLSMQQLEWVNRCNELLPAVIKEVRFELDFSYEGEQIEHILSDASRIQRESFDEFFSNVQRITGIEVKEKKVVP